MTTLIAAGALSAGLLGICSTATASASTSPHTSAHQAITQDLKPPIVTRNFLLGVAGAPTEYLEEVGGLTEHEVTFPRRTGAQTIVDTWLKDPSRFRPAYLTVDVRDFQGASVKRFQFNHPQIAKVVNSGNGNSQTLTVTFDRLIIPWHTSSMGRPGTGPWNCVRCEEAPRDERAGPR
ncbi:hypothetical protein ACIA6T_16850 [Streptomyces sp. NPDC051740]|uniref:hypothetical protein n=1 Tax=Streptomyces sp. NPDC051740 TaxID=3365673 RepID=UPI0037B2EAB9